MEPGTEVSSLEVAVWSAEKQADLKWYTAKNDGDKYTVVVDVANHKYNFAEFDLHAYASLANGARHCVKTALAEITADNYVWTSKKEDALYLVNINNPRKNTDLKAVVWSTEKGCDDVLTYDMVQSENVWSATIDAEKHNSGGEFICEIYSGDEKISEIKLDIPEIEVFGVATVLKTAASMDSWVYSTYRRMTPGYVDCSSFVWRCFKSVGINFGNSTVAPTAYVLADWCRDNSCIVPASERKPGDLIFWTKNGKANGSVFHVAIYSGNGEMWEAVGSEKGVANYAVIRQQPAKIAFYARPLITKR